MLARYMATVTTLIPLGGMDKLVCPRKTLQYTENTDKQSLSMPPNRIKDFGIHKHLINTKTSQRLNH